MNKRVHIILTDVQLQQLDTLGVWLGLNQSDVIRYLINLAHRQYGEKTDAFRRRGRRLPGRPNEKKPVSTPGGNGGTSRPEDSPQDSAES